MTTVFILLSWFKLINNICMVLSKYLQILCHLSSIQLLKIMVFWTRDDIIKGTSINYGVHVVVQCQGIFVYLCITTVIYAINT